MRELPTSSLTACTTDSLLLAEQPYMGVARPEFDPEIRSHAVPNTNFIIFYFLWRYGIEVARVVHGSRELVRLF